MDCLITARGLTRARAMAETLSAAGFPARVVRAPAEASAQGCGYAVVLPQQLLPKARTVLGRYGNYRVFCPEGNGYRETGR